MTEEKTLDALKQEIAVAAASGDDVALTTAIKEYNSRKSEIAKAVAETARKEAEALAGVREKLATELHKAVTKIPDIAQKLQDVKATGFTFKLDMPDKDGVMVKYNSVALAVPAIKTTKSGGGVSGKTESEFGMKLDAVYEQYANSEDRKAMAEAATNTAKYNVKIAVKKRALKEGLLQPLK